MPNYSQSSIYKLCCNDPAVTDIYIGSTTNFTKRKYAHKSCCNSIGNKDHNSYVYQVIRSNGGWDNWSMILVESYNTTTKRELELRERYWIETLGATLNKQVPTRTDQEYYNDNKERIKEYREEHKDQIKEAKKEFYNENKDKIKEYREEHKDKMREYREENKDKMKEYRKKNKDKIKENKDKINVIHSCVYCGSNYTHVNTLRHRKSKKCSYAYHLFCFIHS